MRIIELDPYNYSSFPRQGKDQSSSVSKHDAITPASDEPRDGDPRMCACHSSVHSSDIDNKSLLWIISNCTFNYSSVQVLCVSEPNCNCKRSRQSA